MNQENLGPADRIISQALRFVDHMVHNRPGYVVRDGSQVTGVNWYPVTHRKTAEGRRAFRLEKVGNKSRRVPLGLIQDNGQIKSDAGLIVGDYRPAGLFPEVAIWLYRQVAEVWRLDNEFMARWASYVWGQDNRDLKVVCAALLLVQTRKGDPVLDGGKVVFHDEDFRDVGEAMFLLQKAGKDFNPKLLLRVHDLLSLPGVAAINRELGFGQSARKPFLGRWPKVVEKWLAYREENTKLLEGLVKAGFRTSVIELARRVGYKPTSPKFFQILRWKQVQAQDGRREVAVGQEIAKAETWEGLSEQQICERIVKDKPSWKRIVGLVPKSGLSRAIVAAAIEGGAFSAKDLLIFTPTLEELGLLEVPEIRTRWEKAGKAAEDMRAANIASRVKSTALKEQLVEVADTAVKKAVAKVAKDMRVYFMVDISASMTTCIDEAKRYIAKFLQAFPPERLHVSVFNTSGREVVIKHASAAGVENAFTGIKASGGTDYGAGVRALAQYKPKENEDVIFIFVGDEEAASFENDVRRSGLHPQAFGFVKVEGNANTAAVRDTAAALGIPCFMIDKQTFADPYAIPRTIQALMEATPVSKTRGPVAQPRVSLIDVILKTDLLQKPAWA